MHKIWMRETHQGVECRMTFSPAMTCRAVGSIRRPSHGSVRREMCIPVQHLATGPGRTCHCELHPCKRGHQSGEMKTLKSTPQICTSKQQDFCIQECAHMILSSGDGSALCTWQHRLDAAWYGGCASKLQTELRDAS